MHITLSPQVSFQKSGNEAMLLDHTGDPYYQLDEVGARLWQLLAENGDFEAAVRQLLTEFEVEEKVLRQELRELLEDMAQADLVAWE
jgi:hypothetical protein